MLESNIRLTEREFMWHRSASELLGCAEWEQSAHLHSSRITAPFAKQLPHEVLFQQSAYIGVPLFLKPCACFNFISSCLCLLVARS